MNSKGSTEFVIPDSVTTVGQNAFEGASSLGNVVLGEKVSQVPTSAFKNCGSLSLAEINAKVFDCTPFSKTYTTTDTGIKFLKTATDITNTVGVMCDQTSKCGCEPGYENLADPDGNYAQCVACIAEFYQDKITFMGSVMIASQGSVLAVEPPLSANPWTSWTASHPLHRRRSRLIR